MTFVASEIDRLDRLAQQNMLKAAMKAAERAGHPRFYELTDAEADLHSRKNGDYAGVNQRPMGNFERVAKIMALYPEFPFATPYGIGVIYMMKQLDAALSLMARRQEGSVEGVADRLTDIGVYAKLIRIMYEERKDG